MGDNRRLYYYAAGEKVLIELNRLRCRRRRMMQSTSEPQVGEMRKKALVRRQACGIGSGGRTAQGWWPRPLLDYHLLDPSVVPYVTKTKKKLSAGKRWGSFWHVQLLARSMGKVHTNSWGTFGIRLLLYVF